MFKRDRDASMVVSVSTDEAQHAWSAKQLLIAAATLAVLAAAALVLDVAIARVIKDKGLPGELRRLVRLGEVLGYGGTVALIIATAATLDRRGWRVVMQLTILSFGAGALADGLKLLVARLRPSAAGLARNSLDTFV